MSLPSQRRSFGSRSSRRRGRKNRAAYIVPLILVVALGLWWVLGRDSERQTEAAGTASEMTLAEVTPADEAPSIEMPAFEPREHDEPLHEVAEARTPVNERQSTPPAALVARTDQQSRPERAERAEPAEDQQPPVDPFEPTAGVSQLLEQAARHMNRGELVSARAVLSDALHMPDTTEANRDRIRDDLGTINQELFFGPKVYPGDSLAELYEIQPGDTLGKITYRQGLAVDWRLIQRINRISNPSRIRVGQKIKLVRGPIHAVVSKDAYRMDLYAGPPGATNQWVFLRSFPVGLGADDSTPVGHFVVRPDSKLINPVWRNPRTGEFFASDNPDNPIGERWVGIEGTGEVASVEGMGIHGTIDPDSIGSDASMGCIRMHAGDVELVYEMLEEQVSQVIIEP
ncbi:MAG TPA: LysM peptidoglycan-binding domain-containing protein [Phycisphaerales bacterium]|nr:LysM peptidoglycan-binding domain-containing protein [Phycisphaerales bacterium]